MKATSIKEVLVAMLWLYQNRLELRKGFWWGDKNNHDTVSKEGAVSACLNGCLVIVETSLSIRNKTWRALKEQLGSNPMVWNDRKTTTKQDVIKLLRKCIRNVKE